MCHSWRCVTRGGDSQHTHLEQEFEFLDIPTALYFRRSVKVSSDELIAGTGDLVKVFLLIVRRHFDDQKLSLLHRCSHKQAQSHNTKCGTTRASYANNSSRPNPAFNRWLDFVIVW